MESTAYWNLGELATGRLGLGDYELSMADDRVSILDGVDAH